MDYASTIYKNGTILTMEDRLPVAEAIAVKNGRITAIGSDNEMKRYQGPDTQVIDLKGFTLMPGFYDSHSHFSVVGGTALNAVQLSCPPIGNLSSIADVISALKAKAQAFPTCKVIVGWGYDDSLISEKRHLTRYDLDKVSTDIPIVVAHISGHVGYANSKMLEVAQINRDTPDPLGGKIIRDAETGEPTGHLDEHAMYLLPIGGIFDLSGEGEACIQALEKASEIYAAQGVTTANDGGINKIGTLKAYYEADRRGLLKVRVTVCPFSEILEESALAERASDYITLQGIKIVQDGSIQAYTAYMSEPYYTPYQGDSDWSGYPAYSQEDFNQTVLDIYRAGQQAVCHCNGDLTLDMFLDALTLAQKTYPRIDDRPIVIHAQTARYDQLVRMKALGATPSFFSLHTYYWGKRHMERFLGPNRGANIDPAGWAKQLGLRFSTHCDSPITPQNPLLSIWAAVNRRSFEGKSVGSHQAVDVLSALKSYTIDAAYQYFEDDAKGSIAKGKLADFVILDRNPLHVNPLDIKDIQVMATIVNDELVYNSGQLTKMKSLQLTTV
ncbi:amidohydrolase [Peptococcus simiae]|uniref:Amidohydrolase n=1 Tax=Peptococcus simiae TaxID=1643805 RepID=A0ABW9GYK7_9FIRM